MGRRKKFRPKSLHLRRQPIKHWKDFDAMHEVLHSFPGYFKALLLELLDHPMSHKDLQEALRHLGVRMAAHHKRDLDNADLDRDIAAAIERGVLEENNGKYALTPAGREMSEHMQAAIPFFFETVLLPSIISGARR